MLELSNFLLFSLTEKREEKWCEPLPHTIRGLQGREVQVIPGSTRYPTRIYIDQIHGSYPCISNRELQVGETVSVNPAIRYVSLLNRF